VISAVLQSLRKIIASPPDPLEHEFQLLSRGILEGRVIVTGMGRFDPPLQEGAYRIFGVLVTTSGGTSVDTPFNFPVDIVPVAAATNRTFQRPHVPYTAEEESLLGN
jgi:hypothetical protein